jgi:hypothetical protein
MIKVNKDLIQSILCNSTYDWNFVRKNKELKSPKGKIYLICQVSYFNHTSVRIIINRIKNQFYLICHLGLPPIDEIEQFLHEDNLYHFFKKSNERIKVSGFYINHPHYTAEFFFELECDAWTIITDELKSIQTPVLNAHGENGTDVRRIIWVRDGILSSRKSNSREKLTELDEFMELLTNYALLKVHTAYMIM